jgi:hypothetical protein
MCQPMIFFSKKQEVSPYLHFQSVSSFHQLRESLMETKKENDNTTAMNWNLQAGVAK